MSAEVAAVWCCSNCGAVYHKDYPRCPTDGAEVVLAMRDPLLGKSIGNYVIDKLIGEGGMGRVYVARHATLSAKRYAIKVLLGDAAATASMRKRFTHEAESASKLQHPNLVNVLDFGEMTSGLPYIVMEYVDGKVLTDLMAKPMEPARVVRIARAICEGLVYAHEAGLVHRDLKPDNVMIVTVDGVEIPRIADFGLATSVDDTNSRLTVSGTAMGTPAYAPPEQLAGKQVDARADLYSLGMTMFEMLTGGTLPFEGHIMETMTAKAHREAEPLSVIAPALVLPAGLEALVSKLVRRLPAHRPASAREVVDALDEISLALAIDERAPTVVDANRDTPVSGRTMNVRVERRVAPWLLAVTVVMAASSAGVWWYTRRDVATHVAFVAPTRPAPAPAPALVPAPVAAPAHGPAPEIEMPSEPGILHELRRDKARHKERPRHEHKVANPPAAPVLVAVPPAPEQVPAPPPPVAAPPVAEVPIVKPPTIETVIDSVAVRGSLSEATVRRAVERIAPAIRQCAPSAPQNIRVHFTIGEARRATNVQASGAAQTSTCVASAFGAMRSETAPDVGDVDVDVRIAYVAR